MTPNPEAIKEQVRLSYKRAYEREKVFVACNEIVISRIYKGIKGIKSSIRRPHTNQLNKLDLIGK